MLDQDAVTDAILHDGNEPGPVSFECSITEDGRAVHVRKGHTEAYFSPDETFDLIYAIIERAEQGAWLHDEATVYGIAKLYDLALAVDNETDVEPDVVQNRWNRFQPKRYDYEEDPEGLKDAIGDITELKYDPNRHSTS